MRVSASVSVRVIVRVSVRVRVSAMVRVVKAKFIMDLGECEGQGYC